MPRVLVVDDEADYREELQAALAREGYELRATDNGQDAIEIGARFRPDVLVADWMLNDIIHGLHVSDTLRLVCPAVQTILITGFPSHDLNADAQRHGVFEFIEKPFELERIQQAVQRATQVQAVPREPIAVGVVHAGPDGDILYANPPAAQLFSQTTAGSGASSVGSVLSREDVDRLKPAPAGWIEIHPQAVRPLTWHLRIKGWPDSNDHLLVLIADDDRHLKHHPLVRMLLRVREEAPMRWPVSGRALIVDPEPLVRRMVVAELQRYGCFCHAAETPARALSILERDLDINVVVLDSAAERPLALPALVRQIRACRPNATLVGTSTTGRTADFSDAGLDHFLSKPWRVDDLLNALTGRIGPCVDCSLPLPLRRPRPDEIGRSWICCGCGARYWAVLDEEFPAPIQSHARPVD